MASVLSRSEPGLIENRIFDASDRPVSKSLDRWEYLTLLVKAVALTVFTGACWLIYDYMYGDVCSTLWHGKRVQQINLEQNQQNHHSQLETKPNDQVIPVQQQEITPEKSQEEKSVVKIYKKKIIDQVGGIEKVHAKAIAEILYKEWVHPSPLEKIPEIEIIFKNANELIIQSDRLIGEGGSKKVYDGHRFILNPNTLENCSRITATAVAVLRVDPDYIGLAKKEDTIAGNLASPYIMKPSIAAFELGNEWIMIQEKIPFFYSHFILNKNPLKEIGSPDEIFIHLIGGLEGAALGLAKMHQSGYVHCDIKADNIGMDKEGRGVLIDLGTALRSNQQCRSDGCADYAAPEYAIDPKRDLWAFGILLYATFHPEHKDPCDILVEAQTSIGKNWFSRPTSMLGWLRNCERNCVGIDHKPFTIEHRALKFFNDYLFNKWKPKDQAEIELQALIRKLLSYAPNERGTAEAAAATLLHIKNLKKV